MTMDLLRAAESWLKTQGDLVQGCWPVNPESPVNIWVGASSIALGVVLQIDGDVVEDARWLWPRHDSAHINRCEFNAAVRDVIRL